MPSRNPISHSAVTGRFAHRISTSRIPRYVGRGVAKDEAKATEYYRKAARLGMPEATDVLKSLGQGPD